MSFGATPFGFVKKSEEELISELEQKARELFGTNVDLSVYSPIGAFIRIMASALSENWNALESNYYASYLDTAEGIELDRLGEFAGIPRKQAQTEKVTLTFTGSNAIVIPQGFLVQTAQGIVYKTMESKTIENGTANVQAESLEVGTISRVTSGQLTQIVNPQVGIDSVTNLSPSSGGTLRESDADYRARILSNVGFIKNSGAVPYIKAKMEEEEFIQSVYIAENNKPVEHSGLPPHSLSFVVLGGTDLQVGTLIYNLKPAGVQTVGDISVNVPTAFSSTIEIRFSRPTYLNIYVNVEIEPDVGWQSSNIQLVKTAIVKYIGGIDTIGSTTTEYKGLGIGEDVIAWKSYSYLREITGIKNLQIQFGTSSASINQSSIAVGVNQIAKTETGFINVNVV